MSFFFTETEIKDWPTVKACDTVRFGKYFQNMLENGVYLAPSQFEAGLISSAHNAKIVNQTIEAAQISFADM